MIIKNPEDYEYFCSRCEKPVKINDKVCPYCGANLEETLSEDELDYLTVLKTFTNEVDAQVAVQHLQTNGVEAFISKDDMGGMRPHLQLTGGIRVLIKQKDAEKALRILEAMDT
ncbi:MAG: DUF2007 domain-containing protein [Ignavibacteriales bacterium]|nr:DUF2007 domain-containing protein [Ignavibacteriales bacterium]